MAAGVVGALLAASSSITGVGASTSPASKGPLKVAVVLINFTNDTSQPITPSQAQALVFGSTGSVNSFYRQASFGQISLTGKVNSAGDVFGYFTVNLDVHTCSRSQAQSAAVSLASAQGIALTGYDHYIWYLVDNGCTTAGYADLPGSNIYVGQFQTGLIDHELGHNLGLSHSNSLYCSDSYNLLVTVNGSCGINSPGEEYGDPYDVMGSESGGGDFNGYHKLQLGWFASSNWMDVKAAGTYTIAPLEMPSSGLQLLRIPIKMSGATYYYYVEFRQPIGDDAGANANEFNGVFIHTNYGSNPVLMKAQPYNLLGDAFAAGKTFIDTNAGVSIKVLAVSSSAASVGISFKSTKAPGDGATCVSISVPATVTWGETFSATVTVQNSGTTTWSPSGYDLGRQTHDTGIMGFLSDAGDQYLPDRLPLNISVAVGSAATFSGTFTVPTNNYGVVGAQLFTWRMVDESTDRGFGSPCYAIIDVQPSGGTPSPASGAPTNLTASSGSCLQYVAPAATAICLSWSPAAGTPQGYKVYRKGPRDAGFVPWDWETGFTTYGDFATSGAMYTYYVTSFDSSGNESGPSNVVTVTAA